MNLTFFINRYIVQQIIVIYLFLTKKILNHYLMETMHQLIMFIQDHQIQLIYIVKVNSFPFIIYYEAILSLNSFSFSLVFPPLSLAALREYRPTLTAKSTGIPSQKQPKYVKQDFIWEQSIVLPKT